jgi:hypothetical protein
LGALVAALLMFSPVVSHFEASAQGSSDIDPAAAKAFLADAKKAIRGVDPLIDNESATETQEADSVSGTFYTDESEPVSDFYLEYSVEVPADGDTEPFDFGSVFRFVADEQQFRLSFSSDDGDGGGPFWNFSKGSGSNDNLLDDSIDADGFNTTPGDTNDVVVAVIGDEAAFSLNGNALAVLDLTDGPEPGRIVLATGFYEFGTVAGRDVEFSNITLYSLDDAATGNTGTTGGDDEETPEADETPTEETGNGGTGGQTGGRGGDEETPEADETPTEEATGEGDTYVSPTYGYALTYDSSWTISTFEDSDNPTTNATVTLGDITLEKADTLVLQNELSRVALYGGESTATTKECVEGDIAYFQNTDTYTFFSIAKDTNEEELTGELSNGGYYAVIWVTNTRTNVDTTVFIECRPIVEGESLLLIEHYAADADYNDQRDARDALLAGLELEGNGGTTTNGGDETPEADETPTEEAGDTGDLDVTLDEVDRSGVEGEAVVSASGTSRSNIEVTATGAPEGSLVVVQEGSCDDLSGTADFDAGELDADGASSDRIRITPDELDGNYALTIVDAETEDYAAPLACGNIG